MIIHKIFLILRSFSCVCSTYLETRFVKVPTCLFKCILWIEADFIFACFPTDLNITF